MQNENIEPGYRVWGVDNIPYGPVGLPNLVSWIKEERVSADTWVFFEEKHFWQKASQVPELRMFFQTRNPVPAAPAPGATRGTAASHGIKPGSLRRMKIFADMDEKHLESFLQYMEVVPFKQFDEVVRKGDLGNAMFLVLQGELRARVTIEGKETILSTIRVGEFFGEISLLDHGPRSADVVANEDSVLLKISTAGFERLIAEAPALTAPFLYALSRSIASRVRTLTKRYEDSIHFARVAGTVR
jgi:cyclic nucleotide-binding protein